MTQSPPKPQEQTVPSPEEQSPAQPPESAPPEPKLPEFKSPSKRRKTYLLIGGGVVIVIAGLSAWYFLSRPKTNDLQISGRIEGYETDIGAKVSGRIAAITVREGGVIKSESSCQEMDRSYDA